MTLEQAFHQRWAASAELNGLLPADRFFTGRSFGTPLPHAILARRSTRAIGRSNGGAIEETTLPIHLWHRDYDAGRTIACQIEAVFDRCRLEATDEELVTSVRRGRRTDRQHEDGLWQFTLRFIVQVFRSREPQS